VVSPFTSPRERLFSEIKIIPLLLSCGADIDAKGHEGKLPLRLSLELPNTVRMLLKLVATVSSQDSNGDAPLRLAMASATFNDPPKGSIIVNLIKARANVNKRNLKQITPFHVTLDKSHSKENIMLSG
jgi:ankyrin repeat protein